MSEEKREIRLSGHAILEGRARAEISTLGLKQDVRKGFELWLVETLDRFECYIPSCPHAPSAVLFALQSYLGETLAREAKYAGVKLNVERVEAVVLIVR